jgi:hypothetical protein
MSLVTEVEKLAACSCCGETGRIKARASRGEELRLFCHDEEKSCYNHMRGRYFEDVKTDVVG